MKDRIIDFLTFFILGLIGVYGQWVFYTQGKDFFDMLSFGFCATFTCFAFYYAWQTVLGRLD